MYQLHVIYKNVRDRSTANVLEIHIFITILKSTDLLVSRKPKKTQDVSKHVLALWFILKEKISANLTRL